MFIQIGDVELRLSKLAIAYKCTVFCLALVAFVYGGMRSIYPGVSGHPDPSSSFRSEP